MTARKLLKLAEETFADLQYVIGSMTFSANDFDVRYQLCNDMGTRAGLTTRLDTSLYLVQLNMHVMLRGGPAETRKLLHHELAHVVDDVICGWADNVHGESWHAVMGLLGYQAPEVCHGVDVRDLSNTDGVQMLPAVCEHCGQFGALCSTSGACISCGRVLRQSPDILGRLATGSRRGSVQGLRASMERHDDRTSVRRSACG